RLIEKQKEIGVLSITDGEFRRSWWHFDFLGALEGMENYEKDHGLQFHKVETSKKGIRVVGKIDFGNHPFLDHFKFVRDHAGDSTVKFTIPSPNMLHARADKNADIYPNENDLIEDTIKAYQKAIQAFYDAGCRYLQLDDTSWASLFSEETRSKLVDEATYHSSGGYDFAAKVIFGGLNVDGLFLEFDDERSGSFEPLKYVNRSDLKIVLGLITSKFGELEDKDSIKARIQEATNFVPLNQLCLSPQCGFSSTEEGNILEEENQWAKLTLIKEIAEEVWG
ncbi:putative methyl-tetrahydrofolate methyltransferase, partial [Rhizophagus irregularis]